MTINVPVNTKILSVRTEENATFINVMHSHDWTNTEDRTIETIGNNDVFYNDGSFDRVFIGTVTNDKGYTVHVFERVAKYVANIVICHKNCLHLLKKR